MNRRVRDSHIRILDCGECEFLVKGLRSATIPEPPIPLTLDGALVGRFHGVEIFEKMRGMSHFPQTVADLISNAYFRLTYQQPDGTSATFGSSVIGAPSMRLSSDELLLVPSMETAAVSSGRPHRLSVSVRGRYRDLATVTCTRTYSTEPFPACTEVNAAIEFESLQDIPLSPSRSGCDAFRLITISSMYSSDRCFDGSLILFDKPNGDEEAIPVNGSMRRDRYLLNRSSIRSEFQLAKEEGSGRPKNSPGSPDSPSLKVQILRCSIPRSALGVQAHLDKSENPDDDSLSLWLEWLDAPAVIPRGARIEAEFKITASPPVPKKI